MKKRNGKKSAKKTAKPEVLYGYSWNDEREITEFSDDQQDAIENARIEVEESVTDDDTVEYVVVYKLVPVAIVRQAATIVEKL